MTADELYYAAATGVAVLILGFIEGHVRAIRHAVVPAPAAPTTPAAPRSDAPRAGNHSLAGIERRAEYAGRDYHVHGDGAVTARHDGGLATWRNEAEFRAWADRQPGPAPTTP